MCLLFELFHMILLQKWGHHLCWGRLAFPVFLRLRNIQVSCRSCFSENSQVNGRFGNEKDKCRKQKKKNVDTKRSGDNSKKQHGNDCSCNKKEEEQANRMAVKIERNGQRRSGRWKENQKIKQEYRRVNEPGRGNSLRGQKVSEWKSEETL